MFKRFSKSKVFISTAILTGIVSFKITRSNYEEQKKIKYFSQAKLESNKYEQARYALKKRNEHLQEAIQKDFDILIIGGGCNGSGVLIEGANRGMNIFEK